jgi:hypothetical protein
MTDSAVLRSSALAAAGLCLSLSLFTFGCFRIGEPGPKWGQNSMEALVEDRCEDSHEILEAVPLEDRDVSWYELATSTGRDCSLGSHRREVWEWGLAAMAEGERRFPLDPRLRLAYARALRVGGRPDEGARKLSEARALAEEILRTSSNSALRNDASVVLKNISEKPKR